MGECLLQCLGRFCAGRVGGGGVRMRELRWDGERGDDGVGEVVIEGIVAVEGGALDIEERAMEQM